jgi:hypothetical protein
MGDTRIQVNRSATDAAYHPCLCTKAATDLYKVNTGKKTACHSRGGLMAQYLAIGSPFADIPQTGHLSNKINDL